MTKRVTRNVTQQQQVTSASLEGLDESIPVAGTVIDYDYSRSLNTLMEKTSVCLCSISLSLCSIFLFLQGTLPFMPVGALDTLNCGKYIHGPAQDLEALLQTALGIATFTDGPCGKFRDSEAGIHIPMARWYNEIDRKQLYKDKCFDFISYDLEIEPYFTEYWRPFAPYLHRLVSATWPERTLPMLNRASHKAFKGILEEALRALEALPEVPAKYAPTGNRQKRVRTSNKDEGRYPNKYPRGDSSLSHRLPRPVDIKELSQWQDSMDA
jgi:hypothetical protein